MIRRPPRSTLFPTRRSSDLDPRLARLEDERQVLAGQQRPEPPRAAEQQSAVTGAKGGREPREEVQPDPRPRRRSEGLRSEEHTSELQSRQYLVCRLLLEKKN